MDDSPVSVATPGLKKHVAPLLPALLISIAATALCAAATGATLGLFLGAVLLLTLYLPGLVAAECDRNPFAPLVGAVIGIGGVWVCALHSAEISILEWLRCCTIVLAFGASLAGLTLLLIRVGFTATYAAATVVALGLAWLNWPVWLSPFLEQRLVDWLVPAHPLLTINGVLQHLGSWDRAPLAYRELTTLNQDIPYHPARSVFATVLVHGLVGATGFIVWARHRAAPAPTMAAS